jgi:diaminohydroxyphosphoribosylaminopyrimidine deaminase/5-amino-6-(5-phosphoribosylamino)uracil reductase
MSAPLNHSTWMQRAIVEADLARGKTGDNPWVGCVVVDDRGELLGLGHTQGPGEDHAEMAAFRQASERGLSIEGATLYSTLEPCSFHGRTPACSRVIVDRKIRRVVTGMRDPNPRVDGVGVRILEEAGLEVIEGVCEQDVRRQLGRWVLQYHPHEPLRRARALAATHSPPELVVLLASMYGITPTDVERLLGSGIATEASR